MQADFTDVSVLPVIVQKLKEEKVEVGKLMLFQVNFSKIDYVILSIDIEWKEKGVCSAAAWTFSVLKIDNIANSWMHYNAMVDAEEGGCSAVAWTGRFL